MPEVAVPEEAVRAAVEACPVGHLRAMCDGHLSFVGHTDEEAARIALAAGAPHIVADAYRRAGQRVRATCGHDWFGPPPCQDCQDRAAELDRWADEIIVEE